MTQLVLPLLCLQQHVCHQPADVALVNAKSGLLFGAALAHAHQGIALGVSRPVGSTLLLLSLRGPWGN